VVRTDQVPLLRVLVPGLDVELIDIRGEDLPDAAGALGEPGPDARELISIEVRESIDREMALGVSGGRL
jgi:hypothetical protein